MCFAFGAIVQVAMMVEDEREAIIARVPAAVSMESPNNPPPEPEQDTNGMSRKRKSTEEHEEQDAKKQKQTSDDSSDVIFVTDSKNVASINQSPTQDPSNGDKSQQASTGGGGEEDATGEKDEKDWQAEYDALKQRANGLLTKRLETLREERMEIKRLTEKLENMEEDRDAWLAACRDAEGELEMWKTAQKKHIKELRQELQTTKREEMNKELASIKNKYKRDLDAKQRRHDDQLEEMDEKIKESKDQVSKEKKALQAQEKAVNRKLKETKPETNSIVKQKDKEIQEGKKAYEALQSRLDHIMQDREGLLAEAQRYRAERDEQRQQLKLSLNENARLEHANTESKIDALRQQQQVQDLKNAHAAELKEQQVKIDLYYSNNEQSLKRANDSARAVAVLRQQNERNNEKVAGLERDLRASRAGIRQMQEALTRANVPDPTAQTEASDGLAEQSTAERSEAKYSME
ncbi:Hypothetical predicted protein [Lecanosticta acicola]|uniref:Uncharacterized protein n=1 Tax=Lecanosticta acicola TaxID=111012 RepID=A0AAI8YYV9_9PEZI|nr:Hypothetical predicted protein [Lecanosticta acicola]